MIAKVITVSGTVRSNVAEAEFLSDKGKLMDGLVRTLNRFKLLVQSKKVAAAPDRGMGAVIEIRLRFAKGKGILPNTSYQATGRFVVTKQGDNLSVSFQVSNWGFASEREFANFRSLWSVSVKRSLEKLVKDTYPYEILHL